MDSTRPWHGEDSRTRFHRMTEVLSGIARTAEARCRTRCPHRDARSRCTYLASCRNQVAVRGGTLVCGGDRHLRFEPATAARHDVGP